ncbi:MAG: hypothetical protein A3H51_01375 [Candidatus Spechtbacteria bacterium RIFCSPLOWO2_02_FULL_38_8]|uniref:SpoVT-AbrB domain-containing protein n=1 Tax=Candidatus Spechtbacteria bacterium RIFCSPLOWO2_02_FULL_38_8 TaxID=1802164 RepID=A0A1G2HJY1_9BACT|nr:MAG: hypothetical protein A3H51_01375 [Candidatus Spechtbacteria bacterium RIFCSPLOWO2_02_FULL_38_8]
MPRRKLEKENIRKIQKSGNLYTVSIPIELIRKLEWKERQKVVVKKFGKGLSIKDWPTQKKQKNKIKNSK